MPDEEERKASIPTASESARAGDDVSAGEDSSGDPGRPEALDGVEEARIEELDVREQLRQGGEPFGRIMAAAEGLDPDGILRLRAIFEPVPLYAVMADRGFEHWTEKLGPSDWRVWFWRPDPA